MGTGPERTGRSPYVYRQPSACACRPSPTGVAEVAAGAACRAACSASICPNSPLGRPQSRHRKLSSSCGPPQWSQRPRSRGSWYPRNASTNARATGARSASRDSRPLRHIVKSPRSGALGSSASIRATKSRTAARTPSGTGSDMASTLRQPTWRLSFMLEQQAAPRHDAQACRLRVPLPVPGRADRARRRRAGGHPHRPEDPAPCRLGG